MLFICMNRLHKKSVRMLYAGKHKNKIKTASAREMLGFIWEALRHVGCRDIGYKTILIDVTNSWKASTMIDGIGKRVLCGARCPDILFGTRRDASTHNIVTQ